MWSLLFNDLKIHTETGLLEKMSMQMELEHDTTATATTLWRISCVETVLRTSTFIKKGRKLYIVFRVSWGRMPKKQICKK